MSKIRLRFPFFIVFFIIIWLVLLAVSSCSGTGFEKKTTLMPDSITAGYQVEKYKGDPHAWDGIHISMTWEFK